MLLADLTVPPSSSSPACSAPHVPIHVLPPSFGRPPLLSHSNPYTLPPTDLSYHLDGLQQQIAAIVATLETTSNTVPMYYKNLVTSFPTLSSSHVNASPTTLEPIVQSCIPQPFSLISIDAKQHRVSFPSQPYKPIQPFTLIHSDVCRPSKVTTSFGKRCFVTFIDVQTCLTWVFLISDKSEVTSTFQDFYHTLGTQFNTKIGDTIFSATHLINYMSSHVLRFYTPLDYLKDSYPSMRLIPNVPLRVFRSLHISIAMVLIKLNSLLGLRLSCLLGILYTNKAINASIHLHPTSEKSVSEESNYNPSNKYDPSLDLPIAPRKITRDTKLVGCKSVFTLKYKADGTLDRHKARVPLPVDVNKDWSLYQLDVKNAFLNGDLVEELERGLTYSLPLSRPKGMKVVKSKEGIFLSQRKYTLDLLTEAGTLGCRPADAPIEFNCKLGNSDDQVPADKEQYHSLMDIDVIFQIITFGVEVSYMMER
ncbi:reverse transcriptase [Cucumis melo var. makuwa]|uniref:Reverse transcriptase n=1 Tax=Cucumis melo var. makuwa TaxID=1194695 RepID=A0A5A7VEC5_CUCMM|nr:reverse transcriptase [Cucumis melo var. makuwa]